MTDDTPGSETLDSQDPLPESNWFWRRVYTIATTAIILLILIGLGYATNRIVGNVVGRIDTMDAASVAEIAKQALVTIETMFRLMFWALLVVVTYYMVAPSAEQITKMLQTAGLLKAGVQMASRTVETPRRKESVSTVAMPPQPIAPSADSETRYDAAEDTGRLDETASDPTYAAEDPESRPTGLPSDMPPISV